MDDTTFATLPADSKGLAQGAVRTLTTVLERLPEHMLRCCFISNRTTNQTQLLRFDDVMPADFNFPAAVVRQKAKELNADFCITVLDMPGPHSRTVSVSVETRIGTFACCFPVVRKQNGDDAMALGPGQFVRLRKHTSPFARMLRAQLGTDALRCPTTKACPFQPGQADITSLITHQGIEHECTRP